MQFEMSINYYVRGNKGMWANESVFYQIYPLGFSGAPWENDGVLESRIRKLLDWKEHFVKLGITAIYFSPVFESDTHGYNARDYKKIDVRLGTNEDFKEICEELHKSNIKVVLDGVFNHVGRGFFAFQDVLVNRENSRYLGWFNINLGGNSCYNDNLWYEGWEGNYDLVKLNLRNEEVISYLLDAVKYWIEYFEIDGIRLDVAYCLDEEFMRRLRRHCDSLKDEFFLVGEIVHGDYNRLANDVMLHSVTNYECYKGNYSSLNSMNLFEMVHTLLRQFGPEQWTLYKGKHLLTFVDNHDVSRIASVLNDERHIYLAFAMMFGMPGIPCIYYGSEWGTKGRKEDGDNNLRLSYDAPIVNDLTEFIIKLIKIKKESEALNYGNFISKHLTNRQCVYLRQSENERVYVAINADENHAKIYFNTDSENVIDLMSGENFNIRDGLDIAGYGARFLKLV